MFESVGVLDYWTYLLAVIGIVLVPGPNSIFVLTTAAQNGVVKGYQAACAVFLGDAILMMVSALGVASLLKTLPMLFLIVKGFGALYLCYLGFTLLRGAWLKSKQPVDKNIGIEVVGKTRIKNPFKKALFLSLSNPKAILFFVAFFIQFVDPNYVHPSLSFFILGLTLEFISFIYLTFLIFAGVSLALWFHKRKRLETLATASVGVLFVGFGIKLATASLN
ncbi:leucine efflux protein LeuE [Gammaproteobacteria bacterium ESL0073]|nr:leucine efflux protein LeuE [Gammaproteobacteria bacterium ESL0073]